MVMAELYAVPTQRRERAGAERAEMERLKAGET